MSDHLSCVCVIPELGDWLSYMVVAWTLTPPSGYPWNSTDMVTFAKATRLGEMAIDSDDFQTITGRKPQTFEEVCKARMAAR